MAAGGGGPGRVPPGGCQHRPEGLAAGRVGDRASATLTAPQLYERVLVFLDELVRDSGELTSPLRDRLDAYALTQVLVTCPGKPEGWAPELWAAFTAFRGPAPGADQDDSGTQAARKTTRTRVR